MTIAVVTGASSGMGREFVKQISRNYKGIQEIWVAARRKELLDALKEEINKPLRIFAGDITEDGIMENLQTTLLRVRPKVKLLVNAAGFGKVGVFNTIEREDQLGMVDLNCRALVRMTDLLIPYMIEGGHIIQMASAAAFMPQAGFSLYAATKAFVLSYSRSLGRELAPYGVSVTSVCPGPVDTEFFDRASSNQEEAPFKKIFMAKPEKVVAKAIKDAATGRDMSIYGFFMKAFYIVTKLIPQGLLIRIAGRFTKGAV